MPPRKITTRNLTDFLSECNQQGMAPEEFQQVFCQRCKQPHCTRASWGSSRMDVRVQEQIQRLLHPVQVDPNQAKYAHLVDFDDMSRRAMQQEIADSRGDWEVPEIPVIDGQIQITSPAHVDAAVRAMSRTLAEPLEDVEESFEDVEEPEVDASPEPQPGPTPKAPVQKGEKINAPTAKNTPNRQGVMLDGGPPPESKPARDPWEPPPNAVPSSARKVPVGGTVKMGD